jgi:hypothetical protein
MILIFSGVSICIHTWTYKLESISIILGKYSKCALVSAGDIGKVSKAKEKKHGLGEAKAEIEDWVRQNSPNGEKTLDDLKKHWVKTYGERISLSPIYYVMKSSRLIEKDRLKRLFWKGEEKIASPEEIQMLVRQIRSEDLDIASCAVLDLTSLSSDKTILDVEAIDSLIDEAQRTMKRRGEKYVRFQEHFLSLFSNIAAQAKRHDKYEIIQKLESVIPQAYGISKGPNKPADLRAISLEFLQIMEDERVFKIALRIISKEEDPLFDIAESIVKAEASSNRLKAREALYETFPACKKKARRRILKLLGETREAKPSARASQMKGRYVADGFRVE